MTGEATTESNVHIDLVVETVVPCEHVVIVDIGCARVSGVVFTTFVVESGAEHCSILFVEAVVHYHVDAETGLVFQVFPDCPVEGDVTEDTVAFLLVVDHVLYPPGVVQVVNEPVPGLDRLSGKFGVTDSWIRNEVFAGHTGVFVVVLEITHVDVGRSTVEGIKTGKGFTHNRGIVGALVDPVQRSRDVDFLIEQGERLFQHHVVTGELVARDDTILISVVVREICARKFCTSGESDTVVEGKTGLEVVLNRFACAVHQPRISSDLVSCTSADTGTPGSPCVVAVTGV